MTEAAIGVAEILLQRLAGLVRVMNVDVVAEMADSLRRRLVLAVRSGNPPGKLDGQQQREQQQGETSWHERSIY